ncbi:MAG: universal stress protein, partial [Thermodesulfobacteriota bacterium]
PMIAEIKKILYATDFSEEAKHAFRLAATLANQCKAGIVVLHVIEELSPFALSMIEEAVGETRLMSIKREKETQTAAVLKSRLEDLCRETQTQNPDCPFVVESINVVTGHPVDQIIRFSEEIGCDMLILGSRGQGVLADVTMGSTSRRVLRRCKKPVLIVRLP